jgi:hypothetical protein
MADMMKAMGKNRGMMAKMFGMGGGGGAPSETELAAMQDELAKLDPTFAQIAKDMPGFQKRGVESSADLVPIHPGLAKWMREKGVWDAKWDSKVASK